MQPKIADFHRQLVTINHQLRSYCEKLKPPLLDTLGLNAALNKLIMETKKRAAFSLITNSMGLTGMRERVLAYGGYIDIDTYPNEGMQIHIQVGNDLKND
ncbi:hypothetical protein RhiirA1_484737 [Rhizophagus irregularis]|uniref:Uncharacterized protein n=1 Tax=Rhizophagus irregularis TaxID=588596 RepID=A0A2N0QIY8_9GLOM|nr:hypothetical protein RhiirA1_484737 [Rhizophagus irregularis]